MERIRRIHKTFSAQPTMEGAGVRLNRVFGNPEVPLFDPFLMMDDFGSENPEDYIAGFPFHPHRGIETITYLISGTVNHKDSMGNSGTIGPGDVQWMTAGSGIIHEEMPQVSKPALRGFQLWANLPASHKMMNPRYQEIPRDQIPETSPMDKVVIKVICGKVGGVEGPVRDIVTEPVYLDISIGAQKVYEHPVKPEHTGFAYIIEGEGSFGRDAGETHASGTAILFTDGEVVRVRTGSQSIRFLLISGRPIGEPIVWGGPIVMNTREEVQLAFEEYRNGGFIKTGKS